MSETPGIDRVRARSFGAAAVDYDMYRPRYPDQLVDEVVTLVPGRRVLEVGAGTGIATAAFVACGMAMTCVEPDAQMAAVLAAKLAGFAEVRVEVATFEEWSAARPADAVGFDALISAQAWHWTDPKTRWGHAGAAVRSGGVVALFWNEDHYTDPRLREAYTAAYDRRGIQIRAVGPQPAPLLVPDKIVDQSRPEGWPAGHTDADDYFTDLRTRRYHWTWRMPVADYVARVNTTSPHLILRPEQREDMTVELIATLSGYGDEIELSMTTDLATAVRR